MSVSGVYGSSYWYKVDQAWNQSRAAISQQFLDAGSVVSSAITDAMSNQIVGMATLAAQAALKRIQSKTAAVGGTTSATVATAGTSVAQATTGDANTAGGSSSRAQYTYTSASSILSNANVVNFFA